MQRLAAGDREVERLTQGGAVVVVAGEHVHGRPDPLEQRPGLRVLRGAAVLGQVARDEHRVRRGPQRADDLDRAGEQRLGVAEAPRPADVRVRELDEDEGLAHDRATLATMLSTLGFDIEPFEEDDSTLMVVPTIDGEPLTDLIHRFERGAGMERRDESYGGLIPAFFRFGTPAEHYLKTEKKIPLLGCECGEWGCWPLLAQIEADGEQVVWAGFEQPFRPRRNYSAFGPFTFERSAYEAALRELEPRWA